MDLFLLRIGVLLVGSFLGGLQDAKSGIISDKITYAMIGLGIIFNLAEFNWIGLAIGAIVFGIGYLIYYFGKIGGGDVKLFAGIALLMPFFSGKIFVLSVLFVSAVLAVIFYAVFFTAKYARKGINLGENRQGIRKSVFFGIIFFAYFYLLARLGNIQAGTIIFLGTGFACGLVFLALEKGIRKNFFLKKINLSELEEDEVIAAEFLGQKARETLKLAGKGIIGEKEKEKLEKAGIKEILVYRNLPPFAPFIFIAIITVLAFPEMAGFLFI
ncbi:MAG: A24 family peptidase [Candidatus ainarchaeum sp.]|nr:A24 family peptidase [Candidatus ainarchaeum sp.]